MSAAEAARFAEVVTSLTAKLKELGPLSADANDDKAALKFKLEAAKAAVSTEKLRWVAAKQTEFQKDGNRYQEIFTDHEIGRMLDGVILEEITLQEILMLLKQEALSVKQIAEKLVLPPPAVMSHVQALRKKEQVVVREIKDRSPLYALGDQTG